MKYLRPGPHSVGTPAFSRRLPGSDTVEERHSEVHRQASASGGRRTSQRVVLAARWGRDGQPSRSKRSELFWPLDLSARAAIAAFHAGSAANDQPRNLHYRGTTKYTPAATNKRKGKWADDEPSPAPASVVARRPTFLPAVVAAEERVENYFGNSAMLSNQMATWRLPKRRIRRDDIGMAHMVDDLSSLHLFPAVRKCFVQSRQTTYVSP